MSYNGDVTIHVQRAEFLKDNDLFGKMDPYLKISCGTNEFKTKVAKNKGKAPDWNETFTFSVMGEQNVKIEAYDSDSAGSDDLLGTDSISLARAFLHGSDMEPKKLYDKKGNSVGQVFLKITFQRR